MAQLSSSGTARAKPWPSRRSPSATESLVVVEGFVGAMRLHSLEIAAVAIMGSSISEEQVRLLMQDRRRPIYVTFLMDGDEAGREVEKRVVPPLARHFWVWSAPMPEGHQPDTLPSDQLRSMLY
jgi:DNA primase